MSFSTAGHASMTPPTILEGQFQNRSVCVVRDVVIHPPFQMKNLRSSSPSLERPGPIIFAVGATYIRAYDRRGTIDVDLKTGASEQSRAHPDQLGSTTGKSFFGSAGRRKKSWPNVESQRRLKPTTVHARMERGPQAGRQAQNAMTQGRLPVVASMWGTNLCSSDYYP